MNKTEIREYKNFDIVLSDKSKYVVLKIKNVKDLESLGKTSKEMIGELKQDFLSQSGVYFLNLADGMYIGETNNFQTRLANHIENREVKSITFATYKSQLDLLDKEQIEDIESLLLSYAKEFNLNIGDALKNIKPEDRKIRNHIRGRESEETSHFIWDHILFLNAKDMLSTSPEKKMLKVEAKDAEVMEIPTKKNIAKSPFESKDIKNHADMIDKHHEIFNYVDFRKNVAASYNIVDGQIFNKENSAKCLFMYLFEYKNGMIVEEEILGKHDEGWVTARTLAYFRIPTTGSLGILKQNGFTSDEAKKMIVDFVKNNY